MINLDSMSDDDKLAALESIHKSIAESKAVQKQKIAANVDLVLQALKKMESDIRSRYDATGKTIEKRVAAIKDGQDGKNGINGKEGKDGRAGRDGLAGAKGVDGLAGRNGLDGVNGVSVVDANIDFDGSLIIKLSNGNVLNVGEVVSQDLVERIKVIGTMSTNASISISDESSSISTGVKNINFVGAAVTATASGDDVTVNVSSGTGSVTSVNVSGGTTGLTTSGGPVTTTGTITLAGTLGVANGGTGVITATGTGSTVLNNAPTLITPSLGTPSALVGTNISGTAANLTAGSVTTNANLTGVVTSVGNATSIADAALSIAKTSGLQTALNLKQNLSEKDTSGGYAGLTLFALNLRNAANTVTSFFTTAATAARTWTFPDKNGTVAMVADITGVNSGTNTGDQTNISGNAATVTTNANLTGVITSVGNATSLGSMTSAQLAAAITDETGTGQNVFATSPALVSPALGTPTALVGTNITGTATAFNINGTVGATTPAVATVTALTATADSAFTSTGSVTVSKGTTAQRPATPVSGMFRFNTTTVAFEGYNGTAFASVGGGATGGGTDQVFVENGRTVTTNYTITAGRNAMSTGPVTVNSGVVVTVPSGSRYVVI